MASACGVCQRSPYVGARPAAVPFSRGKPDLARGLCVHAPWVPVLLTEEHSLTSGTPSDYAV